MNILTNIKLILFLRLVHITEMYLIKSLYWTKFIFDINEMSMLSFNRFYADRVFAEYLLYLTNPIWVNLLPMLRGMATKTIERTMAMKRTIKL